MKRPEDTIQRSVIKYLRLQYPKVVVLAIPNGGFRSKTEAAIMSGLGVISGAPDLFIAAKRMAIMEDRLTRPEYWNSSGYHGLFLELKSAKGRLSENQKNMIKRLSNEGYRCEVAYSFDEAKLILDDYLK